MLTAEEKEFVKRQLLSFIERCTADPRTSQQAEPSPAEIAILPRMVEILLEMY